VNGSSATESGYQILPLLGGLIVSATGAGQIVARTGRYKALMVGALVAMAAGLFMLSNLRADTPIPVLWLWMFVTGVGVGPSFAVFTLVVQNSVPVEKLGTATSNLTFFQSVGGTVGLAITGTIFGTTLIDEAPRQLAAADLPPELVAGFAGSGFRPDQVAGVGDLGASILAQVPEAFRAQVQPFIPAIVDAIHQAFSIATANTFLVGIGASLLAAGLVAALKEVPMGHEVLTATADSAATHPSGRSNGRAISEPGA
jgi:MFS family permease